MGGLTPERADYRRDRVCDMMLISLRHRYSKVFWFGFVVRGRL